MKSWLIPVAILVLMIAGSTIAVFALDGDDGPALERLPPVSSDALTEPADCSLADDVRGCQDGVDSACDPVPLRSDCGIDANECNFVHNISVCDQDDLDRLGEDSLPLMDPNKDALCEPVPLRSDCGIDPNVCNQVHNIDACDGSALVEPGDPAVQDASDLATDDLGDGVDSACEPVPLRSDCGIDPNECNLVHNITACSGPSEDGVGPIIVPGDTTGQYRVVVSYNTSVTQPDLDETDAFLGEFDADLEFLVQESWPPTGVANLQTDTPNFCDAIFDELASQSYITDFSCNPQQVFDGGIEDMPVTNLPDVE